MATIKDVAKLANVATSTVSRVLSGNEKCAGIEVRNRIWNAVKELNFVPNQMAKGLKQGDVPNNKIKIHIFFARNSSIEDSYFLDLANYVRCEIMDNSMFLGEDFFSIDEILKKSFSKNEGLIILGRSKASLSPIISKFNNRVAFITLNKMEVPSDHILCDGKEAAKIAMNFLTKNGHKRIAYLGEYSDEIRFVGYKEHLINCKIPVDNAIIINTSMTIKGGEIGVLELMRVENKPTAIFCANDLTAIGAINSLKKLNLKVPQDVSIISIDNIGAVESVNPPITTVKVPMKDLSHMAIITLKDRMTGGHSISLISYIPTELVVRESVKRLSPNNY